MKICSFGEVLIDFTPVSGFEENSTYRRNPGGGPANLAVVCAKLGMDAAMISQVGHDFFGSYLIEQLKAQNVDTEGVIVSDKYNTTLAFVSLGSKGERDFCFYRNPGADVMIETSQVNLKKIDESQVFHYSSLSMTHNPSRTTTFELLEYARRQGKLITYDPNLRLPLWRNEEEAKQQILDGMNYCHILKIADNEIRFLYPDCTMQEACEKCSHDYNIPLILCTRGDEGCDLYFKGEMRHVDAIPVKAIDTTGAGDAFFGSFLVEYLNLHKRLEDAEVDEVARCMRYANVYAGLSTLGKGAIPSFANKSEWEEVCRKYVQ